MARMTLTVDERLLETARQLCGVKTKRETVEIALRVPEGMALSEAVVNGKAPRPMGDGPLSVIAMMLQGEAEITVRFRSVLFECDDEALLDFPFISDDAACAVSIPQGAGEDVKLAAGWLAGYFSYWRSITEPDAPAPSVIEGEPPAGPAVLLRDTAETPVVRRRGEQLLIAAPDAEALKTTVWKVMRALDRRFFTAVPPAPYAGQAELSDGILRWDEKP